MASFAVATTPDDIRVAVGIASANYTICLPERANQPIIAWMPTTGMRSTLTPWVNNEQQQRGAKFIAMEHGTNSQEVGPDGLTSLILSRALARNEPARRPCPLRNRPLLRSADIQALMYFENFDSSSETVPAGPSTSRRYPPADSFTGGKRLDFLRLVSEAQFSEGWGRVITSTRRLVGQIHLIMPSNMSRAPAS